MVVASASILTSPITITIPEPKNLFVKVPQIGWKNYCGGIIIGRRWNHNHITKSWLHWWSLCVVFHPRAYLLTWSSSSDLGLEIKKAFELMNRSMWSTSIIVHADVANIWCPLTEGSSCSSELWSETRKTTENPIREMQIYVARTFFMETIFAHSFTSVWNRLKKLSFTATVGRIKKQIGLTLLHVTCNWH